MVNLPALAEIFRPAGRSVATIEAALRAVDTELATVRASYAEACLAFEEGDGDALKVKQQSEAERAKLAQRQIDLQAALRQAQDRDRTKVESDAAAERTRAWDSLKAANEVRQIAARRMDAALIEFGAAYQALLAANEKLYGSIPGEFRGKADFDAGMVRLQAIEEAVRLDLLKRDKRLNWAISYPWRHTIVPFISKLEDATKVIAGWIPRV
jgi:hypothetical protein